MDRSVEGVEQLLRARGLTLTPQRRAIVRHLVLHGGHWTASELLAGITGEFPLASRATVYSTLALLRDLDVLEEVQVPGGELRFDANPEPHQHFVCRSCGQLEDIPASWIAVELRSGLSAGFSVERFSIVAQGVCAACR